MATSGNIFCGPCETQDTTKLAEHWCPECEEGLCFDCRKHHSALKATRDHGIISIESYRKMPKSILEVSHHCKEHDKRHQNYCPQHDQLCCPVCISTTHMKCTDLQAISELIKRSKTSSLLANMEGSLEDIKTNINLVIKNTEENLSTIADQRRKCIDEVKQMRIKINSHLDKLEQKVTNELLSAEKEAKERIEISLTEFRKTGKKIDELQRNIFAVQEYGSDLQTFFGSKALEAEVDQMEKYMKLLQEAGRLQELNLKINVDDKVSNTISNLTKFGTVSVAASLSSIILKTKKEKQAQMMAVIQQPSSKTINDIKASLASKFSISTYTLITDVRGCAGLPNGKFLFSDCGSSSSLVLVNSEFSIEKSMRTEYHYDVTTINDTLVAVSTDNGIAILDLNKPNKPIKRIKTKNGYCGVTFHKGKILWYEKSIGMREASSDKYDDNVTTIVKDTGAPEWVYLAAYEDNIYTTNRETNTITCYRNYTKLWSYAGTPNFTDLLDVTVDSHGNVYITSNNDNKVVVISPDGRQGRILLTGADGIKYPSGIYFDRNRNILIVANQRGTIFAYNISYT